MNQAVLNPKGPLLDSVAIPAATYSTMPIAVERLTFRPQPGEIDFYPGPMIGADALGAKFVNQGSHYIRASYELIRQLSPDDYLRYLTRYYEAGLARFGEHWGYADIVTVLIGLSDELRPQHYLEIGVRRGRSACAVGSRSRNCAMVLFDMWLQNYAGMENPGPDLVRSELQKVGHSGPIEFVNGDSHKTIPQFLSDRPDSAYDIITVDGDHTNLGAAQDLADVVPRLKIGGAIVFDDICHPKHPGLRDVWRRLVEEDRRFSFYSFRSVGYGVGFAIRKF